MPNCNVNWKRINR